MNISEWIETLPPAAIALALGVIILWLLLLQILVLVQHRRQRRLLKGKTGADLEQLILSHSDQLNKLRVQGDAGSSRIGDLDERIHKTLSRFHLVRFSPFGGSGSIQSFSLALLDSRGRGVVISSLQTQDGNASIYGKPIKDRASTFRLSPEEEEAIRKAMSSS